MHSSIIFDRSIALSDVYCYRFHDVNFFSKDGNEKVIIDHNEVFPERVRCEIGKLIGYDGKKIYKLAEDISKGEVLYSTKKRVKFISGLMGFSVFFDKGSRELVCFDGEGGVKGIVKASNSLSPKACFYNDCFYEFLESEIVITSLNGAVKKIDLPTDLGEFAYIYFLCAGAYLKLYIAGSYKIYKFDYQKYTVDEVFFSKNRPSEVTSFNGKEYFFSGGSLYSINAGEVTEIEKDVGDNFLVVSNGVFFFKKYHNKVSYVDSDDNFYSLSLPVDFFVANIIPSSGNLSAIQVTTALGYEAFGIIPIYNYYINDMKDFFSLSDISMIEESDEFITEEKETDRGALVRLDVNFMDVFTAAQVIAGLTFSAFYKYCYRSDLAGSVYSPKSDKEIEGLFLYSIHKDFSGSDRKLLVLIVEEIFSYYLSNNIVYLENKNLRFDFE